MLFLDIVSYIMIVLLGLVIGSFLNVCIIRIPAAQSIVTAPSHCMACSKRLSWYELIPVFSWVLQKGRCRGCSSPISAQYPLVEAANGILYALIFFRFGLSAETLIYCSMTSALLALSVIDFRVFEIPPGFNWFLLGIGVLRVATDFSSYLTYLIGFFAVSVPLLLIFLITRGRGIGGGDIKLMAVCGLIIGWKLIVLAFIAGCIFASVIHLIRMAVKGEGSTLALGPYLSVGVFAAAMWGGALIDSYLALF